jgi:CheY-like chemotaxis protein
MAAGQALRRAKRERRAVALWQSEVRQRETAQAQLIQSQKMESIGQLTGGVAHDFNNLLTSVIGNIDMAQVAVRDERVRRLLLAAQHAAESAATLTQRLLAFARKQLLQPLPVDLRQLVAEMQDMLGRTLGAAVQLAVAADDRLWPALVDRHQIELAILNLAINARDAMPRGGTLTITLANETVTPGSPDDLRVGDYVVLRVADTGIGMDEATLARAVEPFFTTKDVGKGTGLGLSMVHGIAVQSGGAMRIRSRLGRGTTVEIWLPRSLESADEAGRAAIRPLERGDATILVCDDNQSVREFASEALEDSGYHVIAAENGQSALAVIENEATPLDLLLVDFAMPGINGVDVAQRTRQRRPNLPILLITGNAEQAAVRSEAEGVPLLTKPFKQAQLVSRVADLLKSA